MASSSDRVQNTSTLIVNVPVGATVAIVFESQAQVGACILRQLSGGTLFAIGLTASGITYTAAQLATFAVTASYHIGGSEILNLGGPARMYLWAGGATVVAQTLKGIAGDA